MSVLHPKHIQSSQSLFSIVGSLLVSGGWLCLLFSLVTQPQPGFDSSFLAAGAHWIWLDTVGIRGSMVSLVAKTPKLFNMNHLSHIYIYIYVIDIYYTWEPVWTIFFPVWTFFFWFNCIAYLGFWSWGVVQILWQPRVPTSSHSLWKIWKSNVNPKWSRLGVMIGYPSLATNTPIFATKYGCTHKIVVFFQHHVEKKTATIFQHTAPNTASRWDTHTVAGKLLTY